MSQGHDGARKKHIGLRQELVVLNRHYPFAITGFDLVCFSLGGMINALAYSSLQPIILSLLLLVFFVAMFAFIPSCSFYERKIFIRTFSVGWMMAGVAAIYVNLLGDSFQLTSDPGWFFNMSSSLTGDRSLLEVSKQTEGSLAVIIWGSIYDLLSLIGFDRARFVGVLFNVLMVALAGVLAIKSARKIFGDDPNRLKRMILLFASCGLFWLFASIHLRDALVLLIVMLLVYAWLVFLVKPALNSSLFFVVLLCVAGSVFLYFLRAEFVFVPAGMAMAATTALIFGHNIDRSKLAAYMFAAISLIAALMFVVLYVDDFQQYLSQGKEGYQQLASSLSNEDSLGMTLIVNQPLPLRLVLGSMYLFVFPIPFWSGFQLDSVYHLFKSFNVLYFYFVIPLVALSMWQLISSRSVRKVTILFVLFLSIGFTFAVAATSLETRHFGAFLVPILLVALLPDLQDRAIRLRYFQLLILMMLAVVLVHLVWVIIKFF